MTEEITQQTDELLLQNLQSYQQELQASEGNTLNGVTARACRGLAEAQLRGLNLEPLGPLNDWS